MTSMLNAGSAALTAPSLTEIIIPEVIPASALLGVPLSFPVAVSNDAQLGLLVMLKVSVSVLS